MGEATQPAANPPIDYAVAIWLGMPDDEVVRGLAEGWIRRPPGAGEGNSGEPAGPGTMPGATLTAETLQRWLTRLDASLDASTLEAIWREAGDDDAQRASSLARFVTGSLGLPDAARIDARRVEAALADCDPQARVVRLSGRSGAELESLGREEAGVRRALALHSSWALTGSRRMDAMADPAGRFDRFDPDTGEQLLSDAWLGDRARHASWLVRDDARTVAGDGWRFVDRADARATVEVASSDGGAVHQVIFVRDGGDSVSGGATTDRLHGGSGDDSLRGRAGDDLLEGGEGSDVLLGGSGHDELAGGRGDDELDGGAGNDRLDGGRGGDELAGGRGSDLLRGGAGEDVYVFERGDGVDVVEDDGGTIRIDDAEVSGTLQRDGDGWRSADGRFTVALDPGDGPDGSDGTLRIHAEGEDTVALVGWRQGRYGITLEGPDEGSPKPSEVEDAPPGDDVAVADAAAFLAAPSSIGQASGRVVDWRALRNALAEASVPAPPAAVVSTPTLGVPTPADLADALAEGVGVDDTIEVVAETEAWLRNVPAWWRDGAIPAPFDVAMRRTPAG
jgi:hypothetical protein